MSKRSIFTAELLAICCTIPSAIAITVYCWFWPQDLIPGVPFWILFTGWLVVVACLGGLPAIWRSGFRKLERILLTASHVIGCLFVLPPLLKALFWVIGSGIGTAARGVDPFGFFK